MEIEILGAHHCESSDSRLVSLLVDRVLALDVGALTSGLSLTDQMRVTSALITHHHFDHVRDLATFGINRYLSGTVNVYGLKSTLEVVSAHLLNDVLYPDFLRRPSPDKPTFRFHPVEPGKEVIIDGYRVLPLAIRHGNVPALGYSVSSSGEKSFFYTGDTGGGCCACWEVVSPDLLIIETCMSDAFESTARESGHLTPRLLRQELLDFKGLKGYLPPVLAVHMNLAMEEMIAEEVKQVAAELGAEITLAREGMRVALQRAAR